MKLNEVNEMPSGLLEASALDLKKILGAPTLIHLPGELSPPLFVSVLLHGNETTGFFAMQKLLREYKGKTLPRALSLFIGNVSAAEYNLRRLDYQSDYNRIWPGSEEAHTPEHTLAESVFQKMRAKGVFASLDIHNNTGKNPYYACVNRTDVEFLNLASLFSDIVVYHLYPKGIQSFAFSQLAPSLTLECGLSGEKQGIEDTSRFIKSCLNLQSLTNKNKNSPVKIFHTIGTVTIPKTVDFSFSEHTALKIFPEVEQFNFRELEPGTTFARVASEETLSFDVKDEFGNLVSSDFFYQEGLEVKLRRKVMPAMITLDTRVIRQDCFCYLMERYQSKA